MKNKIKILLGFVLCFICLFFSACGSVRSITITNDDGSISELVYVELNENEVEKAGYNLNEIKAEIENTAKIKRNEIIENFKFETEIKIALENDVLIRQKYTHAINGTSAIKATWSGNTLVTGIKFADSGVYDVFYDIDESAQINLQEEKHFLYSKMYFNGYSKFVRYSNLYDELNAEYQEKYPNLIKENSGELLYTYVTDLRREHSNADYVDKINNKYYHTWVIDSPDEELEIYYNTINKGNVILLVIGISLVVVAVLGIVAIIIRKKNKKNSQ